MSIGIIRLNNAVFNAHHGVTPEERRTGGRFEVDVAMDVDFKEAADGDDVTKTADYEKIYGVVRDIVTGNRFCLIERLAYLIAHGILQEEAQVLSVQVTMRKVHPPVGGPCDSAEAVYKVVRT